jgi:hypothetical protein
LRRYQLPPRPLQERTVEVAGGATCWSPNNEDGTARPAGHAAQQRAVHVLGRWIKLVTRWPTVHRPKHQQKLLAFQQVIPAGVQHVLRNWTRDCSAGKHGWCPDCVGTGVKLARGTAQGVLTTRCLDDDNRAAEQLCQAGWTMSPTLPRLCAGTRLSEQTRAVRFLGVEHCEHRPPVGHGHPRLGRKAPTDRAGDGIARHDPRDQVPDSWKTMGLGYLTWTPTSNPGVKRSVAWQRSLGNNLGRVNTCWTNRPLVAPA